MNRKLVWLSILAMLFLIWGGSGFVSAAPHKDPVDPSGLALGVRPTTAPQATQSALIPVTGQTKSRRLGWETLLFYGLIELAALTLILALLDAANQSTSLSARRKTFRDKTYSR